MSLLSAVQFGLGCVLEGVALTILLLCRVSYAHSGGHDPVERVLTFLGSGVPGTLGLVLIFAALL